MPDDFSAILDVASVPDSPAPEPTPSLEPSAPSEPVDSTTPTSESQPAPEGAEPAPEPGGEPEPRVDGRTNPAQIRSALKAFRDSAPENAPVARELNDGYGRYLAYKDAFGTVADARNAKAFLEANGGVEGLTSLHETIKSVNETDELLYNGDPRVLDNIIEDMRKENKLDSFSKLAGPYLDKLRTLNEKSYYETLRPHFFQGLVDTNVISSFQDLAQILSADAPDITSARALLGKMSKWFDGLRNSVETADKSKLDPDRQAFEQERQQFQTQKQKDFQEGVGSAADSYSNQALGGALKPYLKLPFFKSLAGNRAAMTSLAKEIKGTLLEELSADKTYRGQMDAFFAQKTPDKSRITQYHNAKVDSMSQRIVKQVIETRYPDYSKRTVVTPRPGTPGAKPVSEPTQSGKPEFLKSKPSWEDLDMDKDPQRLLYITGRGYRKSDGKFITWSPKYK